MTRRVLLAGGALAVGAFGLRQLLGVRANKAAAALYETPLMPPETPLNVYHLGHSLVGRDLPAMLAQLAGEGHRYDSQLGWGASLRDHWEPDVPVNGFDTENDHPRFRPAREAIASGDYDAVVFTEMVELKDAIRYHDSPRYLANWAGAAKAGREEVRLYLYETWHHLDDPAGWLARIEADLQALWERKIMLPAAGKAGHAIHVIPGGQAMAAVVREVDRAGGIGNLQRREDLFAKNAEGQQDTIHLSDLGTYLIALTHYATLYHRTPVGLPLALWRADGTPAKAPEATAGDLMQKVVWDVVRNTDKTGVS